MPHQRNRELAVRHAAERLQKAVAAGRLTQAEADDLVAQVASGEGHDAELRGRINALSRDPQ